MINMHLYLPEKYRSLFLHGVFLFSKVEVLVVNFDRFFALAYSSHILWFWPLGRVWCHHTSLSSNLYLKGCQFYPIFFLRKGIVEPALPYGFDHAPPVWSCPLCIQFGFVNEAMWRKVWQGVVFVQNFWNFKANRHKNHFDIDSKQTRYEEIQVIHMERISEVMKNFCFVFGEKHKVTFGWSKMV
jgi:hypothetical protein